MRLESWQSGSAQNCSHQGFLKTLVVTLEVTNGPDSWFAFKHVSMSGDLSLSEAVYFISQWDFKSQAIH